MAYSALDGPDTGLAGMAHLGAMLGPVIPWGVYMSRKNEDAFVAREAAKATNAGMAFFATFILATIIELYVPLVGFVGRLAQLAVLVVAVFVCVQNFRRVRDGMPTSYPYQIKVVKLDD